jgi:hypothetical protein
MELCSDGALSEARKRGSGGGSPRKHDDLLTGRLDLDVQSRWSCTSDGAPTGVLGRIPQEVR